MKVFVIANPSAGRGRCGKLIPEIRARLNSLCPDVECHISRNQDDLSRLARRALERQFDAIVACGGDGTGHYILQELMAMEQVGEPILHKDGGEEESRAVRPFEPRVALGMIPLGTGNDWAISLGLPGDLSTACEVIRRGRTRLIDVARVGKQVYVSVAGAGFDSQVNRLVNQDSAWLGGRAVYVYAVLRTLSKFRPRTVKVFHDDRLFEGQVMLVAVGNGISYGGGLRVLPQARMDDGWLDVCIVKETSRFELVRHLPKIYHGGHASHPAVEIHRARRVEITSPEHMELFGDGEYLQDLPVTIEVVPRAVKFIVP